MVHLAALVEAVSAELTNNILPFHCTYLIDAQRGGFYGSVSNDLVVDKAAAKGSVQCARLLWTYAHAYRQFKRDDYLEVATHAYSYLIDQLWDEQYGGLYWSVSADGTPFNRDKLTYAQAFGIFGLSEYFAATNDQAALDKALVLFELIESKTVEQNGGYCEGRQRDWLLSEKLAIDAVSKPVVFSMNTHLHILEAYANLLRCCDENRVRERLHHLVELHANHIVDRQTGHLRLHMDAQWRSLSHHFSFGHDIEASWLLWESAEILNNSTLLATIRPIVLQLADATLAEGIDRDGAILDEGNSSGIISREKHWWPQAEALVGFVNAYQMTVHTRYLAPIEPLWQFIQTKLIDHTHGEWIWGIDEKGARLPKEKAGMWKTPYHNGRACFELLARLPQLLDKPDIISRS